MSNKDYNGWKNRATWLVNLHIGESGLNEDFEIVAHVGGAIQFEAHVRGHLVKWTGDEVTDGMIEAGLNTVDWGELALTYNFDYETNKKGI